jgi:hypothetical protein
MEKRSETCNVAGLEDGAGSQELGHTGMLQRLEKAGKQNLPSRLQK